MVAQNKLQALSRDAKDDEQPTVSDHSHLSQSHATGYLQGKAGASYRPSLFRK